MNQPTELNQDEITLLRYYELLNRPLPDGGIGGLDEPDYAARKSLWNKGLLAFDRCTILSASGKEAVKRFLEA